MCYMKKYIYNIIEIPHINIYIYILSKRKLFYTEESNKFPVLLWPEKTTTNGRNAILKFE